MKLIKHTFNIFEITVVLIMSEYNSMNYDGDFAPWVMPENINKIDTEGIIL